MVKTKRSESECGNDAVATDSLCVACRSAVDAAGIALEKLKRFRREHEQFPDGDGKLN